MKTVFVFYNKNIYIYIYIYIYNVCVCVYLSSISSLMHISLNNVDIFCLYIFVYVLLGCRIDFMVSVGIDIETTHYASI